MTQDLSNELVDSLTKLRPYAISLTRKVDSANDLIQDTACKALGAIHTFSPGTNMQAWLRTIMRNHWFTSQRNDRRRAVVMSQPGTFISDEAAVAGEQEAIETLMLLEELRPTWKLALVMILAYGYQYHEAADMMGISIGTVKSRVFRARENLLVAMGEDKKAEQLHKSAHGHAAQ